MPEHIVTPRNCNPESMAASSPRRNTAFPRSRNSRRAPLKILNHGIVKQSRKTKTERFSRRFFSWLRGKSLSNYRAMKRSRSRSPSPLPSPRPSPSTSSNRMSPSAPFNSTGFLIDRHLSDIIIDSTIDTTWSDVTDETFSTAWNSFVVEP